ncbi:MAG: SCO family protein [Thermoanaerobaculia bacterium]
MKSKSIALTFVSAVLVSLLLVSCRQQPPLPQLYPVPDLSLVSRHGKSLNLRDLRGSVVVYDFIFTRCGGPCPIMTNAMKRLASKVGSADVRFVSITVDPDYDTPKVLTRYARIMHADDPRWLFLTGDREAIHLASSKDFKLGAVQGGGAGQPIVHSTRFVLADRQGEIRGYYDSMSDDSEAKLIRDIASLVAGK